MDKKTILIGVVLLFLGAGGFLLGTKLGSPPRAPVPTPIPLAPGEETAPSLNALLASKTPRKCTFNNEGDQGTVAVAGGVGRVDFDANFDDGKIHNKYHMIVGEKLMLVWRDEDKTGFKIPSSALLPSATPIPSPFGNGTVVETGGFLSNANYNYKCVAWLPEDATLAAPQGVEFIPAGLGKLNN